MNTHATKQLLLISVLSFGILVSADGRAAAPKMINNKEIEAMFDTLDRSNSLAGPDVNANGIRDDIENAIVTMFPDPMQRRAAFQAAKSLQAAVLVDTNNRNATSAVSLGTMNAINCLFERFPTSRTEYVPGVISPSWVSHTLEAMTVNTKPRVKAYLKYNAALSGTTSAAPRNSTCE